MPLLIAIRPFILVFLLTDHVDRDNLSKEYPADGEQQQLEGFVRLSDFDREQVSEQDQDRQD